MAQTHPIDADALTGIAAEIGERLSSHLAGADGSNWWASTQGAGKPHLCESIQLWALSGVARNALHRGLPGIGASSRLIDYADNTGLWHHQIKSEQGQAVGFATSSCNVVRRREKWRVGSVVMSDIAAAIDKAIKYVDLELGADVDVDVARLLVVPGAHIYAIWVEQRDRDSILIAYGPKSIKGLSKTKFFTTLTFLQALSKVIDKIQIPAVKLPRARKPRAEQMDKKSRAARPKPRK